MFRRWAGPLTAVLIVGGIALIIALNLNLGGPGRGPVRTAPAEPPPPKNVLNAQTPADFREYPIGDAEYRSGMKIAAVWLPPIAMEGMPGAMGGDVIHLEADVHATEGNPNGFAKDEFVPYLKIAYKIIPEGAKRPIHHGELVPMVARDGLHYGASIAMPKAGKYTLIYDIKPPSEGGLGRHSDRVTGVDPWWKPFSVTFDWDYEGPPQSFESS